MKNLRDLIYTNEFWEMSPESREKVLNTLEELYPDQSRKQSKHSFVRTANNRQGSKPKHSPWMPILTEKMGGEIRPVFAKNQPRFGNAKQKGKILRELSRVDLSSYLKNTSEFEHRVLRLLQTINERVLQLYAILNGSKNHHGHQSFRNRRDSAKKQP